MAQLDLALPLDALNDQARLDCVPVSADADAQQMRWIDWSQLITTAQQTFRGHVHGFPQTTYRKISYRAIKG